MVWESGCLMSPDELVWSKSTHSSGGDGGCVEVAMDGAVVCARDSKWEAGPLLSLSPAAWGGFVARTAAEV
ncbi:hypothetical protein Srut_41540 [Streptomyces rutgersensis]|uniref:Domain of uncharacterized function (DUF397) n=2 Tax=Streptomyces TaxID=1883 RepID=A0A380MUX0_STRGR|nr:hypothetical protein Srut_41540 [Streptomyces rutgersensis]SUO95167.1 Domain of uncharacterised function (DUF397) [Streptomyces griseus]